MKNNIPKVMLTFALIFSVIALICSFLRVDITITNDTYISGVLTLVGICTTFIVGYQIYNAINIKQSIEDYKNNLQKDYKTKIEYIDTKLLDIDVSTYKDRILLYQTVAISSGDKLLIFSHKYYYLALESALSGYIKYGDSDKQGELWEYVEVAYKDLDNSRIRLQRKVISNKGEYFKDIGKEIALDNLKDITVFNQRISNLVSKIKIRHELNFEICLKNNERIFKQIYELQK